MVDLRGEQRANPQLVRAMCDRITHRGPDGDGYHSAANIALGMRRLSIIDVRGSDQPLYSADRSIALVFNGEIYNYRELRHTLQQQGYAFYTDGDGETLIHLYERDGIDFLNQLRGMYAFALWDSRLERLILAVDHIGMKPLYLHEQNGVLHFASEVKCLLAEGTLAPTLNLPALDTYLSFGFQVGQETLFEGVRRLKAGHVLVCEGGNIQERAYWQFGQPPQAPLTDEQTAIDEARRLLQDAMDIHLRSDVPLGLFLSGGVDSAAMLGLMAQAQLPTIRTFTIGYDTPTPDNELLHARRIAQHFNTQHHERIIDAQTWWAGFERYVYHEDEPTANASAVSLMLLAEETAKHVKVVLTGLGGDELFGGYPHHHNIPALLNRQARWGKLVQPLEPLLAGIEAYYPAMKRYRVIGALPTYLPELRRVGMARDEALMRAFSFDGMVWSDTLREALYGEQLAQQQGYKRRVYGQIIAESWQPNAHNTALALVVNTWLHGNALLHCDKVTMAHSLEARIPLFDPPLLAFAARLDPALRMRSNKYILREALRPVLPTFALERPKQPFSTPIRGWFARELSEPIQAMLLDDSARLRPLFNGAALTRVLHNHFEGKALQEELVFRLLNLELWLRRFEVRLG